MGDTGRRLTAFVWTYARIEARVESCDKTIPFIFDTLLGSFTEINRAEIFYTYIINDTTRLESGAQLG